MARMTFKALCFINKFNIRVTVAQVYTLKCAAKPCNVNHCLAKYVSKVTELKCFTTCSQVFVCDLTFIRWVKDLYSRKHNYISTCSLF
jgi:hypothetical protein